MKKESPAVIIAIIAIAVSLGGLFWLTVGYAQFKKKNVCPSCPVVDAQFKKKNVCPSCPVVDAGTASEDPYVLESEEPHLPPLPIPPGASTAQHRITTSL